MTFNDLVFNPVDNNPAIWKQACVNFPNGYGASVIIGPRTYGGSSGLYELAVLKGDNLCYDTPITDDVLGCLTPDAVIEVLARIEKLPQA